MSEEDGDRWRELLACWLSAESRLLVTRPAEGDGGHAGPLW
ncbi:hypothetical protein [Streptomyces roseolus]